MKFIYTLFLAASLFPTFGHAKLALKAKGKEINFLYDHDNRALASTVQFILRSGYTSDPRGKEGLAQVSFSSILKGSKEKSRKDFYSALETLGAAVSVETRANYSILTMSAISQNLKPAIELVADAILHPGLRDEDIRSELDEAIAKVEEEKANNRTLLRRAFRKAMFKDTPFGFTAEGTLSGLKSIEKKNIQEFLANQTNSGNVVIAATSNRTEKEVKSWIESAFKTIPDGSPLKKAQIKLEKPKGRNVYFVERPGSTTTEILMGHYGVSGKSEDKIAIDTGLYIFGSDFSSRLSRVLRGENGWTYGAQASIQPLTGVMNDAGTFFIYAFPRAEVTDKLGLKAIEMYETYFTKGITQEELNYARNSLANSYAFKFSTANLRLTGKVDSLLEAMPNYSVATYRNKIKKLTTKSVLSSIQKIHDPENMVIVMVGDPVQIKLFIDKIPHLATMKKLEEKDLGF